MITFLAKVPSLWLNTFLTLVFLAIFTAANKQLCMRYMENNFYTHFGNKTNFDLLEKGGFTVLTYSKWEPVNLCSKVALLKSNTGALSSSFFSSATWDFPMDIDSLTLSSLFNLVTEKFQKLGTREDKLTYFDIRYHRRKRLC